jgi:hypothetical protein
MGNAPRQLNSTISYPRDPDLSTEVEKETWNIPT